MLARDVDIIADREILNYLHIADQCGAGETAFDQVMAQHSVFREPARHSRVECPNVVDPLAGEGAFVQQVLI